MNILKKLSQKLREYRFRRNGLTIVQDIPKDLFMGILQCYIDDGWELADDFYSSKAWPDSGNCKIRKGHSTLVFAWDLEFQGSITGLERIINSLAHKYELTMRYTPIRQT